MATVKTYMVKTMDFVLLTFVFFTVFRVDFSEYNKFRLIVLVYVVCCHM